MLEFRNRRGGVELQYAVSVSRAGQEAVVEAMESTVEGVPLATEGVLLSPMDAAEFAYDALRGAMCRPVGIGIGKNTARSARLSASVIGVDQQCSAEFVSGPTQYILSLGQVEMAVPRFVVRAIGSALDGMAEDMLLARRGGLPEGPTGTDFVQRSIEE